MLKTFHSQKKDINFYKIFPWEKTPLNHYITKEKKQKKYQTPFLQPPPIPYLQKNNSLKN